MSEERAQWIAKLEELLQRVGRVADSLCETAERLEKKALVLGSRKW
jgi:hypothetical protein